MKTGWIVSIVRLAPRRFAGVSRRLRLVRFVSIVLCWFSLAELCVYPLGRVWFAITRGDALPDPFVDLEGIIFGAVILCFLLLALIRLMPSRKVIAQGTTLRAAVLASDDLVAPLVPHQPLPLDAVDLASAPFSVKYLRRPLVQPWGKTILIIGMLGFVAPIAIFLYMGPGQFFAPNSAETIEVSMLQGLLPQLLLVMYLAAPIAIDGADTLRGVRFRSVTVDDTGIRWQPRGLGQRQHTIPWAEAAAFCLMQPTPLIGRALFVLYSPDETFSYEVGAFASEDVRETGEMLTRIITTRTGLPLRDLSSSLKETPSPFDALLTSWFVSGKSPGLPALLTKAGRFLWRNHSALLRNGFSLVNAALLVAVAIGLFNGCSRALDIAATYRASYYASLSARIHAMQPTFFDSLAVDGGIWPVQGSTAVPDAPRSYFADGAYHLSGGTYEDVWVAPTTTYGDVAVEVSMREVGSTSLGFAGLVLRMQDAPYSSQVFFELSTADAGWSLFRDSAGFPDLSSDALYDGYATMIHGDKDAANTLLVVIHGNVYYCYINGVFAGRAVDAAKNAPLTGRIGLYVTNRLSEAVFTNFAVYTSLPPPPPSPLPFGIPISV